MIKNMYEAYQLGLAEWCKKNEVATGKHPSHILFLRCPGGAIPCLDDEDIQMRAIRNYVTLNCALQGVISQMLYFPAIQSKGIGYTGTDFVYAHRRTFLAQLIELIMRANNLQGMSLSYEVPTCTRSGIVDFDCAYGTLVEMLKTTGKISYAITHQATHPFTDIEAIQHAEEVTQESIQLLIEWWSRLATELNASHLDILEHAAGLLGFALPTNPGQTW